LLFGLGGETLTNQLLSRSYGTVDKLQADQPMEMQLAVNALVIETEIEQEQEFTQKSNCQLRTQKLKLSSRSQN